MSHYGDTWSSLLIAALFTMVRKEHKSSMDDDITKVSCTFKMEYYPVLKDKTMKSTGTGKAGNHHFEGGNPDIERQMLYVSFIG